MSSYGTALKVGAAVVGAGGAGVLAWLGLRKKDGPAGPKASIAPDFKTPVEAAEVRGGWIDIGGGIEMTRMPLFDSRPEVRARGVSFARLSYAEALEVAARLGARLPTCDELDRAAALPNAHRLSPCTLPANGEERTEEWAKRHDLCVVTLLEARALEPGHILISAGKHYAAGAPEGKARICGWYDKDDPRKKIQHPYDGHGRNYRDYAQTTELVREKRN